MIRSVLAKKGPLEERKKEREGAPAHTLTPARGYFSGHERDKMKRPYK